MSDANRALVERLCDALQNGGTTSLLTHLSPDIAYHNVPWPVVHGHEGVRKTLSPFIDGKGCAIVAMDIHHTVAEGDVVMNARDETWQHGDVRAVLPVAGVFRIRDGLITHWSDYFDVNTLQPILDAMRAARPAR